MRRYITPERVLWLILLLVFVTSLSGCISQSVYESPITNFGAEVWYMKIFYPLALLMNFIGKLCGDSFGWALIITTIIVRTAAWPIYAKGNDVTMKMQMAQPDIDRVQQKYRGRDDQQSKQRMQMEIQAVYKKHDIKFGGCFLQLLQPIIFMGFYSVVKRIQIVGGSLIIANNEFLGIFDLTQSGRDGDTASRVFGWVAAILVAGTMLCSTFIAQRKPSYHKTYPNKASNPQAEAMQKQMKIMMMVFPVFMFWIALDSNAMALYWVVGNLLSIGQTIVNRKLNEKKYYKLKEASNII